MTFEEKTHLFFHTVLQELSQDESEVIELWKVHSSIIVSENDTLFRQKFLCKDWRETVLKTHDWENRIKMLVLKMNKLKERL